MHGTADRWRLKFWNKIPEIDIGCLFGPAKFDIDRVNCFWDNDNTRTLPPNISWSMSCMKQEVGKILQKITDIVLLAPSKTAKCGLNTPNRFLDNDTKLIRQLIWLGTNKLCLKLKYAKSKEFTRSLSQWRLHLCAYAKQGLVWHKCRTKLKCYSQ